MSIKGFHFGKCIYSVENVLCVVCVCVCVVCVCGFFIMAGGGASQGFERHVRDAASIITLFMVPHIKCDASALMISTTTLTS